MTRPRDYPDSPDLPPHLDAADARLESRAQWDGVAADESVTVAEHVADAYLRECVWTRADLVGTRFTGLRCKDVRFINCDLSGALLDGCELERVSFESCRMAGTILSGAVLREVLFADCSADLLNLRMSHLRRCAVDGGSMRRADFYRARLEQVRLQDVDLTQSDFDGIVLSELSLHGSTVDEITGAQSLSGAHIDAAQVLPIGAALVAALGLHVS